MTTQTEALKLALEALEKAEESVRMVERLGMRLGLSDADLRMDKETVFKPAITAIKEALAQQSNEQVEPVVDPEKHPHFYTWTWDEMIGGGKWRAEYGWKKPERQVTNLQALYTTPPQRKPLTDEQIDAAIRNSKKVDTGYAGWVRDQRREFARAIEAAHGIKENT